MSSVASAPWWVERITFFFVRRIWVSMFAVKDRHAHGSINQFCFDFRSFDVVCLECWKFQRMNATICMSAKRSRALSMACCLSARNITFYVCIVLENSIRRLLLAFVRSWTQLVYSSCILILESIQQKEPNALFVYSHFHWINQCLKNLKTYDNSNHSTLTNFMYSVKNIDNHFLSVDREMQNSNVNRK